MDRDRHGTCAKLTALLCFDPIRDDPWQVLQHWTGVATSHAIGCEHPAAPRKLQYCRNDAELDARIARDVLSIPPMPPIGPGPNSTKHGRNSSKAVRNGRLPRPAERTRDSEGAGAAPVKTVGGSNVAAIEGMRKTDATFTPTELEYILGYFSKTRLS